jgi:alpha-beta hydrolase superfamily lysophospholipase
VGTAGGGLRPYRRAVGSRRTALALALAIATGLVLCACPASRAVEPGIEHAMTPASLGLRAEDVAFPAMDSTTVLGWWLQGAKDAPVVVIASRGTGTMADQLPAAQQFLARGFSVLTFDYRGFGPGSSAEAVDSLRYIIFDSQWVDDLLGALRYARARGGSHVFAWGQDLGSAVALAAAARAIDACDAVAVEGLFRTSQDALNANGMSVMQEVVVRHRRLVRRGDEPFSAGARLGVPLLAVLAGKDDVTPPAITKSIIARVRTTKEAWQLPAAGHLGAEKTPGYFDHVAQWFKRWTAFPPAGRP